MSKYKSKGKAKRENIIAYSVHSILFGIESASLQIWQVVVMEGTVNYSSIQIVKKQESLGSVPF